MSSRYKFQAYLFVLGVILLHNACAPAPPPPSSDEKDEGTKDSCILTMETDQYGSRIYFGFTEGRDYAHGQVWKDKQGNILDSILYTYDESTNQLLSITESNAETQFSYPEEGKVEVKIFRNAVLLRRLVYWMNDKNNPDSCYEYLMTETYPRKRFTYHYNQNSQGGWSILVNISYDDDPDGQFDGTSKIEAQDFDSQINVTAHKPERWTLPGDPTAFWPHNARRITETDRSGMDLTQTPSFEYNAHGYPVKIHHGAGHSTTLTYYCD